MAKDGPAPMFAGFTLNCAHGVEEPTPRKPVEVKVEVAVAPNCA